jgi:hypothetical protein
VIGGLMASTFATLMILPSVFAIAQGGSSTVSASLDPDDPDSQYHVNESSSGTGERP